MGGALRDSFLGQPIRDLDVVVSGQGAVAAAELAERFHSRAIPLGGHRFAAFRVMRQGFDIDLWDRGTNSLTADMGRRDFSIHSFALDLHNGDLHDPFSGLVDLSEKRLRMTTAQSFVEDPLRVLRLCRFASLLDGFQVDEATRTHARDSVEDLTGIARERIRVELESTLAQAHFAPAARLWTDLRIFPDALLAPLPHPSQRLNLQDDLARVSRGFEQAAGLPPLRANLVNARMTILLALLERVGGPGGQEAREKLHQMGLITRRLSRRVDSLLNCRNLPSTESQMRWWLHRAGGAWPEALCVSAALASLELTDEKIGSLLRRAIEIATRQEAEIFEPVWLISGADLQRELGIAAGEQLGRILAKLRRHQIEGSIQTRDQAVELAARLVVAQDPK